MRLDFYRRAAALVCLAIALASQGEAQLAEAHRAEQAGNLAAAEAAYERELKARPAAGTWQRLGLIRHLQNKFAPAIPAFQEAVRLDPSLWTSHLFLGMCLYRTNQFGEALEALQQAERGAPERDRGRDEIDFWLGATRIALRKPIAGLRDLERLIARNPRHAEALELAARTYADASASLWNEVAERHFDTAAGWEVHGHALESEGAADGALDAYRRSKELAPKRAGPGRSIGRLLLNQGKAEEALAELQRELLLAPGDAETSYYAGLAATQLGRYAEARPMLEVAARWPSANPEAPLALAQVHLALRDPEKAVETARLAVQLSPSSQAAHEVLTAALSQAGRTQEVEEESRRWQGAGKR